MPCEYRAVRIRSRQRNKNRANQKKKMITQALAAMGYEVEIKKSGPRQLFILGSGPDGKMEIIFDERTGRFVVHFDGVATHDKEHEIFDQLAAKLKESGYEVSSEEFKDSPKLPEGESPRPDGPLREGES